MNLKGMVLFGVCAACTISRADAAIVVSINQVGPNVVAVTSGTFDTTGLTFDGIYGVGAGVGPDEAFFSSASTAAGGPLVSLYRGLTGPNNFGSGTGTGANSFGGDLFYLFGSSGYVGIQTGKSGTSVLAATTTFAGSSLASIGLTPGAYVFSAPNDTITVNVSAAAPVPEPATWGMMLAGFGAIGFSMRRRANVRTNVSFALT